MASSISEDGVSKPGKRVVKQKPCCERPCEAEGGCGCKDEVKRCKKHPVLIGDDATETKLQVVHETESHVFYRAAKV